jgi:DNA-binding NarL/FixJ family response regulator
MIGTMGGLDPDLSEDEVIRVLVVDEHGMVRRGMRSYLSIFDDIEVVGEAANGPDALRRLHQMAAADEAPDVVLMDLAMEPVDGVTVTRELRAMIPDVEVVAVTSLVDQSRVQAALEAGASGYLVKDAAPEELAVAIRAAHRGEVHIDAALARRLMDSLNPRREATSDPFGELSERELEILRLIAEGHANKEAQCGSGGRRLAFLHDLSPWHGAGQSWQPSAASALRQSSDAAVGRSNPRADPRACRRTDRVALSAVREQTGQVSRDARPGVPVRT